MSAGSVQPILIAMLQRTAKSARLLMLVLLVFCALFPEAGAALPQNDIVFVAQMPLPADFGTVNATFGNQGGSVSVRGFGDLYIRYGDGTLRNLTAAAGYGVSGMQGATAVAVRDPAVHWNGKKIIFSMVVGAPTQRYQVNSYFWQLYEITNFAANQTPVIAKVANQPAAFNNVMPLYASDGETIIFSSDRPRNGASHLYPQRDEYESAATNTGLWSLSPATGDLKLLDHAPSGDFNPIIDSYGRVIFTRWDHLQRDQQADNEGNIPKGYGAFNFADESENAAHLDSIAEFFPEHEDSEAQAEADPATNEHRMNQFFPWMMNQDGTELETLNHVGRQELQGYIQKTFKNDPALDDYYGQYSRTNQHNIQNFLFIREDPMHPGTYYGIDCPEFGTHAAGQIVSLDGPPALKASQMAVTYVTHRSTASTSNSPGPEHTGLYRTPLPLSDGSMIASHTSATQQDSNIGSTASPQSKYAFRLRMVVDGAGGYKAAGSFLTAGISKSISFWSPDDLVSYSGELWELQPVEVVARTAPAAPAPSLETPEQSMFTAAGTDLAAFKAFLKQNNLALIVGRNLTTRDSADIQQPFNLKVADSATQTVGNNGTLYTIKYLQLFQGDQIRGYGSSSSTGRRALAVPLHDAMQYNLAEADAPAGAVHVAADGSFSAIVPARRALTWQLTDPQHKPVVRERYWVTFQPGEVRVCASCHGVTGESQAGQGPPTNAPLALQQLLLSLKGIPLPTIAKVSISPGRPRIRGAVAKYKIALKATKGIPQSAALRLEIAGKTCGTAAALKFNAKGKSVVTASVPLTGGGRRAKLRVSGDDVTDASKNVALPALRGSKRSRAAACQKVRLSAK